MTKTSLRSDEMSCFEQSVQAAVNACLEAKGMNVVVLDMVGISDLTDSFVVVSGRSDRHAQGISNRIFDALANEGRKPMAIDGLEQGHWVVMDYGSLIVHVFYESVRDLYDIEGFWKKASRYDIVDVLASKRENAA